MSEYQRFAEAFHAHASSDPNERVYLGMRDGLGALPDPSLAHAAEVEKRALALADQAAELWPRVDDFNESLDLELAELKLRQEAHRLSHRFNDKPALAQTPVAGDAIGEPIFMLFVNDPRPAGERLMDITSRLEGVPAFLSAMLARLDRPVARWARMDIEKLEETPSLLDTICAWAEDEGFADLSRLNKARAAAEEAMTGYRAELSGMECTEQLAVGREVAERIVALNGIEESLEWLHTQATQFLADTGQMIDVLRRSLIAKYDLPRNTDAAALHRFLNERFRVQVQDGKVESVLDRYHAEREKILAFIQARDLFPVFDAQDMQIMRTPAFMAPSIPAGAMMPPAPFRDGVRTSMVYLTLSEALLDEHTELGIPVMMIHEGIPGHHLQLAWASKHPSVIRRHTGSNAQAEGWTTMLEDYMLDQGYMGELTEEARFCAKRDISRIGARVAIDLFFMTGEEDFLDVGVKCNFRRADPFEGAGNLLRAVTGFTPERTEGEVSWYSQERGYPLSYLTGNRLVWALKDEVTRACAGRLQGLELDREFHRVYLEAGNMPVRFLHRVYAREGLV